MNNEEILIKLSEKLKLKGFSKQTIKVYVYNVSRFMIYFKKDIKFAQKTNFEKYILILINKKFEENIIRQIIASLNFTLLNVLNKDILSYKKFPRPKKKKKLPKVLSKNQIKLIFENINNDKHKLMVEIIYSAGIRVSEIVNLKKSNLNFDNNTILIEQSKGKKDRITILSKKVKEKISKYLIKTDFKTKYFFETNRYKKYTIRSVELILKKASENLNYHVTPHMLRHSFATHLLEQGVDIRMIQKLLGHSNLKTTTVYTKVAVNNLINIKSPYD
ncbi:MAG: tyrosine-type recombinase/integrase [Nanoarchaeota archaeon]